MLQLTRASSRKSLFDSGQRRNSLAASLGRRSAAAAGTQDQRRRQSRIRLTRQNTQLAQLLPTARAMYNDFLERPGQPLVLGSLALLVGFYLAGSLSTIFGAKGFWEPVIALGPLLVSERVTQEYFTRLPHERSPTLKLCADTALPTHPPPRSQPLAHRTRRRRRRLNALKNGFYLGIVLDALKLAG